MDEKKKVDQTPEWMSDEEYNQHRRSVWNDLQADINNPSPAVKKATTIASVAIIICVVAFICSLIILGIVEVVKAIF